MACQKSLLNDFSNTTKDAADMVNSPEDVFVAKTWRVEFVLYDFTHSRKSASKTLNASGLESAAIVLRIPFHKRESMKYIRGDRINAQAYSEPSDISSPLEQVKVVLPIGNHGLPSGESEGPSSLLDRWKHGGGCDCGGWDMACPLILLGNPGVQFHGDSPLVENYQPLELFSQSQMNI
ncbi:hypothetical protein TSUD_230460 [Trifolium subterraneum]|nr:hypothetical protein TSUD_230460 [Trifolium subterraneum]